MSDRALSEAMEKVKRNPTDGQARKNLERLLSRIPVKGASAPKPKKKKKTETRVCNGCCRTLSIDCFAKTKSSNNGKVYRRRTCKKCNNRKREESRAFNRLPLWRT